MMTPDPRLARLRAAVEKATSTVKRSEVFAESYYRGFGDMRRIVLALLDAEAGEPEPTCPCEQRAAQNNADPTAPPPSDARERLVVELFACAVPTMHDARRVRDAILAAIREHVAPEVHKQIAATERWVRDELDPIAENLNATATNATDALTQVAALTARVERLAADETKRAAEVVGIWTRLSVLERAELKRAAPSGERGARAFAERLIRDGWQLNKDIYDSALHRYVEVDTNLLAEAEQFLREGSP
jgi:hypothetical protein